MHDRARGPSTDVRDSLESPERSSTVVLVAWSLAAAAVPFAFPVTSILVLGPGFLAVMVGVAWVVVAWFVITYVSLAWVVAGGRRRATGAAIILGELLGLLLFAAAVFWAVQHSRVGST